MLVVVAVLVSSGFLVSDARGQGRVQGEVTDKWGNGLAEVQIAVERTDGGGSYSAVTEDDGDYIILGLQSGNYEITFTLDGYQGVLVAENVRSSSGPRLDVELEALPSGGRLRGEQEFEAEGGSPKIKFKEDGIFEFEDAEGEEGEGTYGVVELSALLVVRDYDGDDDKYSVSDPVVVAFANDLFTSLTWEGATLRKK
jgi:hypothetical protein